MEAAQARALSAAYDALAEGRPETISMFKAYLASDTTNIDAMMGLVVAYDRLNPPDVESGTKLIRAALRENPKHPTARYNLGLMSHRQGLLSEAAANYAKVVAGHKDGVDTPPATLAAALVNTGLTLEAQARGAYAVKFYREALAVVTEHAAALAYLAVAMFKEGAPVEEVQQLLDRSLASQPGFVPALLGKALVMEAQHDLPAAVAQYAAAANNAPEDAVGNIWFRAGQLQHVEGKYPAAARCFQKARGRTCDMDEKLVHLWLGMAYQADGKLDLAEVEFRSALALDAEFRDAKYRLALVCQKADKRDDLLAELREVVAENPSDVDAKLALGNALLDVRDPVLALPPLEDAVAQAPSNPLVQFSLGVALQMTGSPERARVAYQTALSITSGHPGRIILNMGLLHAAGDRREEAMACFRKAMSKGASVTVYADAGASLAAALLEDGKADDAAAVCLDVLDREPTHTKAMLALGYTQLEAPDKAVATMESVVARMGRDGVDTVLDMPFAHGGRGVALHHANRLQDALDAYSTALSLTRQVSVHSAVGDQARALETALLCNMGTCHWSLQHPDEAATHFRMVLSLDPEHKRAAEFLRTLLTTMKKHSTAAAYYNEGAALQRAGNFEGARELYKQAVQVNRKDAMSHYSLGVCCAALGDVEEGIRYLQASAAVNPSDATTHTTLATLLHTLDADRWEEAVRRYELALSLDSQHFEAHANLGLLLMQRRRFKDAVPHLRGALAAKPDYPRGRFLLGTALRGAQQFDAAVVELKAAFRASAMPDWEAKVGYGLTLDAKGKPEEALDVLQEVLTARHVPRVDVEDAGVAVGNISQRLRRLEEAMEGYNAALKVNSRSFPALVGKAALAQADKQWPVARDLYATALRVRPHDEEIAERLRVVEDAIREGR